MRWQKGVAIAVLAMLLAVVTVAVFDLISLERSAFEWGSLYTWLAKVFSRRSSIILAVWLAVLGAGTLLIAELSGLRRRLRSRPWARLVVLAAATTAGFRLFAWANQVEQPFDANGRPCTLMYLPPDCAVMRRPLDAHDAVTALVLFVAVLGVLALLGAATRLVTHAGRRGPA